MRLGTCYFPEHWPESDWDRHIQLMKQAGLDTVRMGEFAWSRIEKASICFSHLADGVRDRDSGNAAAG